MESRSYASSVTFDDHFLVIGGGNGTISMQYHKTMEVIKSESDTEIIDIPFTWYAGCTLRISQNEIMLISGQQDGSWEPLTWIFDLITKSWSQGPTLNIARAKSA